MTVGLINYNLFPGQRVRFNLPILLFTICHTYSISIFVISYIPIDKPDLYMYQIKFR